MISVDYCTLLDLLKFICFTSTKEGESGSCELWPHGVQRLCKPIEDRQTCYTMKTYWVVFLHSSQDTTRFTVIIDELNFPFKFQPPLWWHTVWKQCVYICVCVCLWCKCHLSELRRLAPLFHHHHFCPSIPLVVADANRHLGRLHTLKLVTHRSTPLVDHLLTCSGTILCQYTIVFRDT